LSRKIRIDGQLVEPMQTDLVEAEPGVYSVLTSSGSFEVRIAGDEISIGAHRLQYEIEDPRQWNRSGHSGETHGRISIKAAMPGKVVRVLVAVGDEVTAGQGILVVEAMKMQNEMKSPRAGRVTSIEVKPNDSVNAGFVLATIE